MGRCEAKTGIEPFGRLVTQVMEQEPYCSAERVFWVVDNGSSHRGTASEQRLMNAYGNTILIHTPVHASWLNQVEIYFSMVQRKVLTPNDFASLQEVETRLRLYEELTNQKPHPFKWKFDRKKLAAFLQRLEAPSPSGKSVGQTGSFVTWTLFVKWSTKHEEKTYHAVNGQVNVQSPTLHQQPKGVGILGRYQF